MEGVVDWILRDLLTSIGGIDQCVTEFIRVTTQLVPDKVYYEYCPELKTGGRTRSGIPVLVQLLGGQAGPLAENAHRVAELGALGIDFNFGCPAKTVNRHDGGASLLKNPERLYGILSAAMAVVPSHVPVSAKIRLGYDDPSVCIETAQAVEAAGVKVLTVHCRTKTDMYKPPAFWEWIPRIKEKTNLKIIANGEVWTVDDFRRCQEVTGCDEIMIGRGAIANPFLFKEIKQYSETQSLEKLDNWTGIKMMLPTFFETNQREVSPRFAQSRTKQWLAQISKRNENAKLLFDQLKVMTNPAEFQKQLETGCNLI